MAHCVVVGRLLSASCGRGGGTLAKAKRSWQMSRQVSARRNKMKAACALVAIMLLSGTRLLAETFDYDGSSLVSCVCPVPAGGSDCSARVYRDFRYAYTIAVKRGVTINLTDYCFRRRDRDILLRTTKTTLSRQNFQALPRAIFVPITPQCIAHRRLKSAESAGTGIASWNCRGSEATDYDGR